MHAGWNDDGVNHPSIVTDTLRVPRRLHSLATMSLLDVIGPVMIGPSSSHTAGACRLALLARSVLLEPVKEARLVLHGSFAKTARGHGTDLALLGGLLGFAPDDARLRDAFTEARAAGLGYSFVTEDLGDVHPNSVRLELKSASEEVSVTGSSLGAGLVKVFLVNGIQTYVSGSYHTLLVQHEDRPGVIAQVARVIAEDDVNIATIFSRRERRGGRALMAVEVERALKPHVIDYLRHMNYAKWVRVLPAVMEEHIPASSILERNAEPK